MLTSSQWLLKHRPAGGVSGTLYTTAVKILSKAQCKNKARTKQFKQRHKLKSVSSEDSSPISINTENSHLLSTSAGAGQSAIRPGNSVSLLPYLLEDFRLKPTHQVIQIIDQN